LYRRLDGSATQIMGGKRREVALKTAHGGTGGADNNDGICHGVDLLLSELKIIGRGCGFID
jgi:hypothetical protein